MNKENINRIIFLDLDGVLADFEGSFRTLFGISPDSVTDKELWGRIDAYGKAKFFSELEWMPDGKELWAFVTQNFIRVKILSALGKSDKIDKQTSTGKREWLSHHLPILSSDDIILVNNKHHKQHYCKPGDILIDDTESNINEWSKKGGIGILHKTAGETINILKRYI